MSATGRHTRLLRGAFVLLVLLVAAGFSTSYVLPPDLPGNDVRVHGDQTALNQAEPAIGSAPDDPTHLVAAWIDENRQPGQRRNLGYSASFNGGATWQSSLVAFTGFPPGYNFVDPSVIVDGDGNAYLGMLGFGTDHAEIYVSKSTDGGLTFPNPVFVGGDEADKPYLALDPGQRRPARRMA